VLAERIIFNVKPGGTQTIGPERVNLNTAPKFFNTICQKKIILQNRLEMETNSPFNDENFK
jgi:hypothetical protein